MSPRPSASEERIPQILQAALSVFARRGMGRARMDDIAGEAGLSKGTLYNYFESKDSIIESIVRNLLARELDQSVQLAAGAGSVAEKLEKFIEIMVADLAKMRPFIPLFFELISLASRRPGLQKLIRHYFGEFQTILETLIRQGIESGEFRPVDVREAALAISAIFEGTILLWVYAPDLADFRVHIHSSTRLLLDGLCSTPSGSSGSLNSGALPSQGG